MDQQQSNHRVRCMPTCTTVRLKSTSPVHQWLSCEQNDSCMVNSFQGCSLGLERLGLKMVSRHFLNVSVSSLQLNVLASSWSRDSNISVLSRSRYRTSHLQLWLIHQTMLPISGCRHSCHRWWCLICVMCIQEMAPIGTWIFLPNLIKIYPYNFELYRFKVGAFFDIV